MTDDELTPHTSPPGAPEPGSSSHADAPRPQRGVGPPMWLWVLSFAIQAGLAALLTRFTYFFIDDFIFLREARTEAFGVHYLRQPLFEHFSPVTRALDKVLIHVAAGNFAVAHAVQIAIY